MPGDDLGTALSQNFRFSSQWPHTIYPREGVERTYFLWLGPGLVTWTINAQTGQVNSPPGSPEVRFEEVAHLVG